MARRAGADRSGSPAFAAVAAVVSAIVVAVTGCSGPTPSTDAAAREPSGQPSTPPSAPNDSSETAAPAQASAYTLMQMNLCLSGLAGCYGKVAYPAAVEETVTRVRQVRPDAVTLNETCHRDVEQIARRTGYHVRFTRIFYLGAPLLCAQPGSRGLFGDAVLTEAPIRSVENRDFEAQAGPERRRWLCISTRDVDVCTAHLNTRTAVEIAGNEAQCEELATLLARRAATRTVVFGGDVNRQTSCAPDGVWTRTDASADQAPGLQHVYGSKTLRSPSAEVLPADHTDHDVLVVRARLAEHISKHENGER